MTLLDRISTDKVALFRSLLGSSSWICYSQISLRNSSLGCSFFTLRSSSRIFIYAQQRFQHSFQGYASRTRGVHRSLISREKQERLCQGIHWPTRAHHEWVFPIEEYHERAADSQRTYLPSVSVIWFFQERSSICSQVSWRHQKISWAPSCRCRRTVAKSEWTNARYSQCNYSMYDRHIVRIKTFQYNCMSSPGYFLRSISTWLLHSWTWTIST